MGGTTALPEFSALTGHNSLERLRKNLIECVAFAVVFALYCDNAPALTVSLVFHSSHFEMNCEVHYFRFVCSSPRPDDVDATAIFVISDDLPVGYRRVIVMLDLKLNLLVR